MSDSLFVFFFLINYLCFLSGFGFRVRPRHFRVYIISCEKRYVQLDLDTMTGIHEFFFKNVSMKGGLLFRATSFEMRDNKEQGSLGVLFFLSFEARSVGRYVDGRYGFLKKIISPCAVTSPDIHIFCLLEPFPPPHMLSSYSTQLPQPETRMYVNSSLSRRYRCLPGLGIDHALLLNELGLRSPRKEENRVCRKGFPALSVHRGK